MKLTRAHGLGNVYLVLDEGPPLTPSLVQALCDVHTGIGADGVLEPVDTGHAGQGDYGVRIWNPDGSVAEKSGNGLRIFARWLADRGAGDHFSVWTGSERVPCDVSGTQVVVDMGRATLDPRRVPVRGEAPQVGVLLEPPAPARPVVAIGVGNPHCVVFVDEDLDGLPWRAWGAALESHPAFPNRTNVQVARVAHGAIALRIWERGAGETPASGSSACAVAAAAVHLGLLPAGRTPVRAPGGELIVEVSAELDVRLEGPVAIVGAVQVDARWLADAMGSPPPRW